MFVYPLDCLFHISKGKIVNPPSDYRIEFYNTVRQVDTPTPFREFLNRSFELCDRLLVRSCPPSKRILPNLRTSSVTAALTPHAFTSSSPPARNTVSVWRICTLFYYIIDIMYSLLIKITFIMLSANKKRHKHLCSINLIKKTVGRSKFVMPIH